MPRECRRHMQHAHAAPDHYKKNMVMIHARVWFHAVEMFCADCLRHFSLLVLAGVCNCGFGEPKIRAGVIGRLLVCMWNVKDMALCIFCKWNTMDVACHGCSLTKTLMIILCIYQSSGPEKFQSRALIYYNANFNQHFFICSDFRLM